MTMKRLLLTCTLSSAVVAGSAHAVPLLTDDFESYDVGKAVPTSGMWSIGDPSGSPLTTNTVRDESTATPFGTPNRYVELIDDGPAEGIQLLSHSVSEAVGAVTTFSFDFVETAGGGDSPILVGYSIGNQLNTDNARNVVVLDDGTVGWLSSVGDDNTYQLDTAYTLYMIFNDTSSGVDYEGGTIDAGTAHIWLQELDSGNLAFAGVSSDVDANTGSSYRVGFNTWASLLQTLLVDNAAWDAGIVIPEPSSLALLGLGGLLCSRRRR